MNKLQMILIGFIVGITALYSQGQEILGTGFSYQGQLDFEGSPVNEPVDLIVSLYDVDSGGVAIAAPVVLFDVPVENGRFVTNLDFGMSYLDERRWIQFEVKMSSDTGMYTTIAPRQEIKPAPVALFALSGNVGPMGPQGEQGPQGPQGPSIIDGYEVSPAASFLGSNQWTTVASKSINTKSAGVLFGSASASVQTALFQFIQAPLTMQDKIIFEWRLVIDGQLKSTAYEENTGGQGSDQGPRAFAVNFVHEMDVCVSTIELQIKYAPDIQWEYNSGGLFDFHGMTVFWDYQ